VNDMAATHIRIYTAKWVSARATRSSGKPVSYVFTCKCDNISLRLSSKVRKILSCSWDSPPASFLMAVPWTWHRIMELEFGTTSCAEQSMVITITIEILRSPTPKSLVRGHRGGQWVLLLPAIPHSHLSLDQLLAFLVRRKKVSNHPF
jgi:hypothetical protein